MNLPNYKSSYEKLLITTRHSVCLLSSQRKRKVSVTVKNEEESRTKIIIQSVSSQKRQMTRKMRNIYGLGDVNLQIENFTWSALVKSYLKGSHIFKTLLCL